MTADGRPLGKAERQRLIASLVSRRPIRTQHELLTALERAGCSVTQATVSRDVRDLALEKADDSLGRPRFVLPQRRRGSEPRTSLRAVLRGFAHRAVHAGNLVVVQSELGSAPAIARALDRLSHPLIVGTLAGDDTCLVVAPSAANARELARELAALIAD